MTAPCLPADGLIPVILVVFAFGAAFGVLVLGAVSSWLRGE